jgi:hypothetical protein
MIAERYQAGDSIAKLAEEDGGGANRHPGSDPLRTPHRHGGVRQNQSVFRTVRKRTCPAFPLPGDELAHSAATTKSPTSLVV